jgi:glycosyltransferase involved in cell wall biosynthesis
MRIGIMLRHYEQQDGGVKVYTRSVLPHLFALPSAHQYVLIYQSPRLIGTYAGYGNVEELAIGIPGTVSWDQLAVPYIARKKHLDLIFNPKITVPFFTAAKTAYVVHGAEKFAIPEHFRRFDQWYFKRLMPLYARHADAIVPVANVVKTALVQHLGADPGKVFVIHNGLEPSLFHPIHDEQRLREVRERYQLPQRFILWAGQIETRKNVARLLQAFAQIKDRVPHQLVLAGGHRWNSSAELRDIGPLGISERVSFPGWIPQTDLPAVYSLADLFAFPSLHEGFGIPLLEAMACGCPIVCANTGSMPEVVAGAACLVDPLNVQDIAHGLLRVLHDEPLRADLIERGLARAKHFSWERTAQQLLAMFDTLGKRPS